MTWYAVHDGNGRLVSVGEVLTDNLPADLTAVQLQAAPDFRSSMWDEATRSFVARPMPVLIDRLDDLRAMAGVQALWNSLNATQRQTLANALIALLGGARYRKASQSVAVRDMEP